MRKAYVENNNYENLVLEIVLFLKKWGLYRDVQLFANGRCYWMDDEGNLNIKDYSNPQRLLDMTFEGALSLLLKEKEYEVRLEDMSDEVYAHIFPDDKEYINTIKDEIKAEIDSHMGREYEFIDPIEFDSFDEWMKLSEYCEGHFDVKEEELDLPNNSNDYNELSNLEFSSREEYDDFISRLYATREDKIRDYFEEDLIAEESYYVDTFFDNEELAREIKAEFDDLFSKYGLRYELGFAWTLTSYRV